MEIFYYLIRLLFFYSLIYCLGTIVLNSLVLQTKNEFSKLFYRLFTGVFFIVCAGALIVTGGKTVFSILILFVIALYVKYASKKSLFLNLRTELKSGVKPFLIGLIPLLIVFSWKSYTMFSTETLSPVVINMDSLKQVIRASFLMTEGVETLDVNYLVVPTGLEPYHYFEAWLIGLGTKLTLGNGWLIEQLLIVPIVSAVIVSGLYSFLRKWNAPKILYLIGIVIVNFSPLYIKYMENISLMKYTEVFFINAFDEWKGVVVSMAYMPVMLFFNLLLVEKKTVLPFLVLLFLPIMSITLAPGIFSLVVFMLFLLLIFRRRFGVNIDYIELFFPFFIAVCIFSFYEILGSKESFIEKPSLFDGAKAMISFSELKIRGVILAEKVIQALILFFPILFIFGAFAFTDKYELTAILKDKRKQILFVTIFIGIVISSIFWMLLYESFGASQFLFYTMSPFTNISSVLIVLYFVSKTRHVAFKRICILLMVALLSFTSWRSFDLYSKTRLSYFERYSLEYIDNVITLVGNLDVKRGLKFEDPENFVKYNDTDHLVGNFLAGNYDDVFLTSVSKYRMYKNKDYPNKEAAMFIPKVPLAIYDFKLRGELNEKEFVELIIDKENFRFALFEKGVEIPNYLKERLFNEVIDKKTGERFYLIQ